MEVRDPGRARRTLAIACAVCIVLQLALAPQVSILGGTFNFMMVLVCCLAMTSEVRTAVLLGFFCGLFFDLTSSTPIGLMALTLTIVGFLSASAAHGTVSGFTRDSVRFVGVSLLAANLFFGFALFLLGSEGSLLVALGGHGLASTALDLIAALPLLMVLSAAEPSRGFTARPGGTRYKSKSYKSLK